VQLFKFNELLDDLYSIGEYGFLLPEDQIIPTGEETLAGLIALLQYIEKQVYN
jgi:hypothetical protein